MPWIVGGAIIGGSLISANSAESTNAQQIGATNEQMQNAHQWEVNDLRAAGLNPMLSAGASPQKPGVGTLKQPFTANSFKDSADAIKKAYAETDLIKAQEAKVNTETDVLKTQLPKKKFFENVWDDFALDPYNKIKQNSTATDAQKDGGRKYWENRLENKLNTQKLKKQKSKKKKRNIKKEIFDMNQFMKNRSR